MPFIDAGGVTVNFPFEPYPCQVDYMTKVVQCYQQGYNGILESPTGTGKTLCLLCASLAWLEDKRAQISSQRWKLAEEEPAPGAADLGFFKAQLSDQLDKAAGLWQGEIAPPKIIYASRTHSQLSQAIQELKRTAYHHFKVCVLGSREQLCIHPQVQREEHNTTKVHLCRAKVNARMCHFYNNLEAARGNFMNQVLDIEDLVRLGEKHNCCPYYVARELRNDADIIFMPYNYLLDPKSRKAHGVDLQGNIVIFDEAHNLEKMCEDSASFDLTAADIASAIRELDDLSQKLQDLHSHDAPGFDMTGSESQSTAQDFNLDDILQLKAMFLSLEEQIDRIPLPKPQEGVTKPGKFIFELLGRVNLSFESKAKVTDILDKIVAHITSEGTSSVFSSKGLGLTKMGDVVKIVFSREPDEYANIANHQGAVAKHYKVHIREAENKYSKGKKSDGWGTSSVKSKSARVLSYWCFSPGHAMQDLKDHGVKSIILTSGTLSPINSFMSEMGIKFDICLENPHVIEKHQVWIGTIGKGPDGVTLTSAYHTRFNADYQASLGNSLVNFARVVPHGLLVFFPSYPVMNKCLEHWQNGSIWNRVEQYKPIFVEPRNKSEFMTAMEGFYEKINDQAGNGAVFTAVCRGKVSEGLDFSDINGRAVVITGLPFPPRMDPKVMLKMQFLDEMKNQGGGGLSGQQWYRQQASRAVNQAIGRVIRHKDDYGAILLCDSRFSSNDSVSQLPSWIRGSVTKYTNFGSAIKDMLIFFKTAEKTMPTPRASKKKSRPGVAGCQGAYFEPTLSRTKDGAVPMPTMKAGAVATHVPSLVTKPEEPREMNLAKLKIQYEDSCPASQKPVSSKGLLFALESSETQVSQTGNEFESQIPSFQPLKTSLVGAKMPLRKKIILKKTNVGEYTDNLQTAEQYIAKVKTTLSAESYRIFSQALREYKKCGEYEALVTSLAEIFTDTPEKYPLLRKFYRFVRPHHKRQFDKTCLDITGAGCGFKPEDAVSKKRLPSNEELGFSDKKRKIVSCDVMSTKEASLDTKSTMKASAIQPLAAPSLACLRPSSSGGSIQRSIFDCLSKHQSSMSAQATTDGESQSLFSSDGSSLESSSASAANCRLLESSDVTIRPERLHKSSAEIPVTQEVANKDGPGPDFASLERVTSREIAKDTGNSDKENSEANSSSQNSSVSSSASNPAATLEAYVTRIQSGYTCCRCAEDASIPLKALCEHVCCMECWKICIRDQKCCPKCERPVKRKHLSRLFFPSGPNRDH